MKSSLYHSGTPTKPAEYSDIFPLSHPEWDDLRVPVTIVKEAPGREPQWVAYKGGMLAAFEDQAVEGQEQAITFVAQMPHSYYEGSDVEVHIHWVGEDNSAGNVAWTFTHSWADIFDVFPTETTVHAIGTNNTSALDVHNLTDLDSTMNGAGKTLSNMIICSLRRNSSNATDTYSGKDAMLMEIDFHFRKDTLGSQQELSKN